jgi:hypothetical protein
MLVGKIALDSRTAGAPEYGASVPSVVRRFSAGASMAAGFRLLLAMNCQVAAVRRTELKLRTPGHRVRCGNAPYLGNQLLGIAPGHKVTETPATTTGHEPPARGPPDRV